MDNEYILVTGSSGLIGSRFIEHIINRNNLQLDESGFYPGIIGIDLEADWGNHFPVPGVRNFKIDLASDSAPEALDKIFTEYPIKYVYHFAAYAAEILSYFMRSFNYKNNMVATSNIFNACVKHGVEKLIYTSSMSVYGDCYTPYMEIQRPRPHDPYAISKAACEKDIEVSGEYFGLKWTIIRPHNVFGRNQNMNDTYRNVLGIWMHHIYDGNPITIYGDGEQTRCFTEVTNILEPLYRCMEDRNTDGQIINVGGIQKLSLNQLADMVLEITGTTEKVYLEPRNEIKFCDVDPTKSIRMLDYKDNLSVYEGIENMWKWVQEENPIGEWYQWNAFELDKGIYSYWKSK